MNNQPQTKKPKSAKIIVLCSLGIITAMGILGYVVLGALHSSVSTEPLTSIASACVGSLGTFLATEARDTAQIDPQEEYELLIGRAATRNLIAEAMRKMGDDPGVPNPPTEGP